MSGPRWRARDSRVVHLTDGFASVRITPVRWEFSERDDTEWNWLVVEGAVNAADQTWSFEDALFTPREGLMLADWLEQLHQLVDGASFSFTEPEVRFERRPSLQDDQSILDVFFDYEAAPPSLGPDDGGGYVVRIRIDRERSRSAAQELRSEIRTVTAAPPTT